LFHIEYSELSEVNIWRGSRFWENSHET